MHTQTQTPISSVNIECDRWTELISQNHRLSNAKWIPHQIFMSTCVFIISKSINTPEGLSNAMQKTYPTLALYIFLANSEYASESGISKQTAQACKPPKLEAQLVV